MRRLRWAWVIAMVSVSAVWAQTRPELKIPTNPQVQLQRLDAQQVKKAREGLTQTQQPAAPPTVQPVLQANPRPKGPGFTTNPGGGTAVPPDEAPQRPPAPHPDGGNYDPGYDYSAGYEYEDYDPGYYDGGYYYDPGYSDQPVYEGAPAQPAKPEMPRSQGSLFDNPLGFSEPSATAPGAAVPAEDETIEPRQLLVATAGMPGAQHLQQQVAGLGYRVRKRSTLPGLGMVLSVLQTPEGKPVREAAAELRTLLPDFLIDGNTRYGLSGTDSRGYAARMVGWKPESGHCGANRRIALIDTPIDIAHPALRNARVVQKSLVPGGVAKAEPAHGTAVAALLVGTHREDFGGLVPDAELYVYDVFRKRGQKQTDTTAEWIIRALDQAVQQQVDAVNLSLGGPPNALLDVAIRAVLNRQVFVIAAAGNGGQDAPPAYPAAYPGVVAVTAVDARRRVYKKANRGAYVQFAAPGVDIWAAKPGGGGHFLSGTSYAAPFVTAALVSLRSRSGGEPSRLLQEQLMSASQDLGDPGRDPVFGWGLIQNVTTCPRIANVGTMPSTK
ncbi:MAG: S8 family serine peptidase [Gammaproteobacteria bacterium]|nr:S8 family serine peptidase [Gammaproteobacteria bacterium]